MYLHIYPELMKAEQIIYQWHFDPAVIALAGAFIYFFYQLSGFKLRNNTFCFLTAILFFLLASCSPLHFLSMNYYFSAHMVAHVILLLLCGPLLVIAIPDRPSLFLSKGMKALSSFLFNYPWVGWLAGVSIMWLWHVPAFFDASFGYMHDTFSLMSLLHAGSILLAGMLFSWPLFGPFPVYHIHPLAGIVYLFTGCASCSLLGLLITFAPPNTYRHYLDINNSMAIGTLNPLNISPAADQKAAGLIMWVPCCFVYLAGCFYLLHRCFAENDTNANELIKLKTSTNSND
jgi:putative membrane protein